MKGSPRHRAAPVGGGCCAGICRMGGAAGPVPFQLLRGSTWLYFQCSRKRRRLTPLGRVVEADPRAASLFPTS